MKKNLGTGVLWALVQGELDGLDKEINALHEMLQDAMARRDKIKVPLETLDHLRSEADDIVAETRKAWNRLRFLGEPDLGPEPDISPWDESIDPDRIEEYSDEAAAVRDLLAANCAYTKEKVEKAEANPVPFASAPLSSIRGVRAVWTRLEKFLSRDDLKSFSAAVGVPIRAPRPPEAAVLISKIPPTLTVIPGGDSGLIGVVLPPRQTPLAGDNWSSDFAQFQPPHGTRAAKLCRYNPQLVIFRLKMLKMLKMALLDIPTRRRGNNAITIFDRRCLDVNPAVASELRIGLNSTTGEITVGAGDGTSAVSLIPGTGPSSGLAGGLGGQEYCWSSTGKAPFPDTAFPLPGGPGFERAVVQVVHLSSERTSGFLVVFSASGLFLVPMGNLSWFRSAVGTYVGLLKVDRAKVTCRMVEHIWEADSPRFGAVEFGLDTKLPPAPELWTRLSGVRTRWLIQYLLNPGPATFAKFPICWSPTGTSVGPLGLQFSGDLDHELTRVAPIIMLTRAQPAAPAKAVPIVCGPVGSGYYLCVAPNGDQWITRREEEEEGPEQKRPRHI